MTDDALLDAVMSVFGPFVGNHAAVSVLLDEMSQALYDAGFGIVALDDLRNLVGNSSEVAW